MFLARPDVVFIGAWTLVLALYLPFPTNLTPPFNPVVAVMLGFNMVTAPIIFYIVRRRLRAVEGPEPPVSRVEFSGLDLRLTNEFLKRAMLIWAALYVTMVIYSGGLPVFWAYLGINKGYGDFGIPTLGGFNNMLRCFLGCLFILLFIQTHRWIYLGGWFLFLILYLAEVTRGGLFVFVLHSIAIFLLATKLTMRRLLLILVLGITAASGFMVLGALRGIDFHPGDYVNSQFALSGVSPAFFGLWLYITTSLGNLNYAASIGLTPTFVPANTIVTVFPTVIRSLLLPHATYPIPLVSPSFNTTTVYAPIMADYGALPATLFVTTFQFISSYVYLRARRGSAFHLLLYPPLFAALALSVIYIYILSLVVLAYPWLCVWYRNFVVRRRAEELGTDTIDVRDRPFGGSAPTVLSN